MILHKNAHSRDITRVKLWRCLSKTSRPRKAIPMHSTVPIFHSFLRLASMTSAKRTNPSLEPSRAERSGARDTGNDEGFAKFDGQLSASAKRATRNIRREERRRTYFRQGKLFTTSGKFLSQCIIYDRSQNGARVRADKLLASLKVVKFVDDVDKIIVEAKVAWQRGNELGLAFRTASKFN
jgi:hypothetical protein